MVKEPKEVFRFWMSVFIWMLVIFGLSCIPGKSIPKVGITSLDKVVHIIIYGILGALLIRAFWKTRIASNRLNINLAGMIILSIIIASAYGVSDEWHQKFVKGRECDALDLAADIAGAAIGVFIYKKRG